MTGYEVDISWVPDSAFNNSSFGIHYIGWQIGRAENRGLALWIIAPVIEEPEPLEDLLPPEATELEVNDDVGVYGYTRTILPTTSIGDLETLFNDEIAIVTQAVIDGYR